MSYKIKNIKSLEKPKFIKPFLIEYELDKKLLKWECISVHDSVSVLLFDVDKKAFVLVKQLRIPLLLKCEKDSINLSENGISYELCSGIMDKNLSEEDTIKEEILEECGYRVDSVEKIASFYGSLGTAASKQTFFYTEVSDEVKVSVGGGIDDEKIEIFYLPIKEAKEFIYDENIPKPASLAFCFMWFFDRFKA